jgi:hypothetical protein
VKILKQSGHLANDESIPVSERLSRPIGTVKQKTLESIEQPTFQPTIAKKSREIFDSTTTRSVSSGNCHQSSPAYHQFSEDYSPGGGAGEGELYEWSNSSHGDCFTLDPSAHSHGKRNGEGGSGSLASKGPTSVYLRSQRWQEEREQRMKREKLLREEQELTECSFHPKIKETPQSFSGGGDGHESWGGYGGGMEQQQGGGGGGGGGKSSTIAERQAEWQRRRDQKIERERREKEMRDLAECSFTPSLGKIQDPPGQSSAKGSNQR